MLHRYKKGYPKLKAQEKNKDTNTKTKAKKKFKSCWNGVPATARHSLFESSLYETFFASFFWHVMGVLLICLMVFCFDIWGITPILFPKPQVKMRDIEFVLNNRRIHHRIIQPNVQEVQPAQLPVSMPKTEPANTDKRSKPTLNQKGNHGKGSSKSAVGQHSQNQIVPGFSMSVPNLKSLSSGLGHSGSAKGHTGESSNTSIGDIDSAFSSNNVSSASSGFDKTATKKMITAYDISPYVNELKRNIRWNWKAPKEGENKRVELFLRIAKDGRLIILNVKRTSEVGAVDNAALDAVKRCLPLNPLPSKYAKGYLDLIFTFGSNSVGSRY